MRDPKKPPPFSQRKMAAALLGRRRSLTSEMIFIEKSMSSMDFHDFSRLIKARQELREINERLDTVVMKNYVRSMVK